MDTLSFIARAREAHGDRYGYEKSIYHYRRPVTVTCREHGDFEIRYDHHIGPRRGGCRLCYFDSITHGREAIVRKMLSIHSGRYAYGNAEISGTRSRIAVTCRKHGDFFCTPAAHMQGTQCPACSREESFLTHDKFMDRCSSIHGDTYDYSLSVYAGSDKWLKIICRQHGIFEKTPDNHCHKTKPQGCPKCIEYFGYRDSLPGYLYLMASNCGSLMKIGISNNPKRRHAQLQRSTPFPIKKVSQIRFDIGRDARMAERSAHRLFSSAELSGFDGCSEWFHWDDEAISALASFDNLSKGAL